MALMSRDVFGEPSPGNRGPATAATNRALQRVADEHVARLGAADRAIAAATLAAVVAAVNEELNR